MVVVLISNGSTVKVFKANSIEEVENHVKSMNQWEERFYKTKEGLYYINGKKKIPMKLNSNPKGLGDFDEILAP